MEETLIMYLQVVDHVTKFAAVIEKNNIFAVQFHPEKSQKDGLTLLKTFVHLMIRRR